MAALLAGLPVEVPGTTVNRLCASGLEAVNQAARAVAFGEGDLLLAGGVESMTRAPLVTLKPERGLPARRRPRSPTARSAGASSTRAWPSATRPRAWARRARTSPSATRSRAPTRTASRSSPTSGRSPPREAGLFADEIVPIEAPAQRRGRRLVEHDEGPRARHDAGEARQAAPGLPRGRHGHRRQRLPAQRRRRVRGGRHRGDGAAPGPRAAGADRRHRRRGRGPRRHGHRARSARPARRSTRAGLTVDDIDLVEINEAFASQVLAVPARAGLPHGEAQRQRRGDLHRPPARLLGRRA